MNTFELSFVTDTMVSIAEDQLAAWDPMVSRQGSFHTLALAVPGETALDAAKFILPQLEAAGVRVVRLDLDLVSQSQIAIRSEKSRAAVSNWVTGQRQAGNSFPSVYTVAGGPVWVWSEVNEWLRRTTGEAHDGLCYPSSEDVQAFNTWLNKRRLKAMRPSPYNHAVAPPEMERSLAAKVKGTLYHVIALAHD